MPMQEVEAKFHVMTAALPEPRRKRIWTMRDRLLEPDATFEELAQVVRPSIESAHA